MDTIEVKIIDDDGQAIAFLLNNPAKYGWTDSYMHIGQHSEAQDSFMRHSCHFPETAQEIIKAYELVMELESIGYVVR